MSSSSVRSEGLRAALRAIPREGIAGLTVAATALPGAIAAGTVTYGTLGPDYRSAGLVAGLLSAGVAGLVGALLRTPGAAVTAPSVLAALVQASLAPAILAAGGDAPLAVGAMFVSLALCGLWQILFGLAGFGEVIRYTPQPVVAGLGAGLAALVLLSQLPNLLLQGDLRLTGLGIATLAVMLATAHFAPRWPTTLIGLVFATVVEFASGLGDAPGYDTGDPAAILLLVPPRIPPLGGVSTEMIWLVLGTSLAAAAVGVLDTLMAGRSTRRFSERTASPHRELVGLGGANLASVLFGSVPMTTSGTLARVGFSSGGRGPATRLISATAILIVFPIASVLLSAIPAIALNATVIFFALRVFDREMLTMVMDVALQDRRGAALRNLFVFGTVLVGTVGYHPAVGVLLGTLLAGIIFIRDMARPVVAARVRGDRLSSRRGRPSADRTLLAERGKRISILRLQGVLFFGNSEDLIVECHGLEKDTDILILDLKQITSIDVSGLAALRELDEQLHTRKRASLFLAHARPEIASPMRSASLRLTPDLDTALEEAEDLVLDRDRGDHSIDCAELDVARSLQPHDQKALIRAMQIETYGKGDKLCRTGEAGGGMWIVLEGSASVFVPGIDGLVRVGGVEPGAPVGELSLIEALPRSADVIADGGLKAAFLDITAFEQLKTEAPEAAHAVLTWIASVTARRLRATSQTLSFLGG